MDADKHRLKMNPPIIKEEFIQKVRESWAELDGVLSSIKPPQMAPAHAEGEWTSKDALAHITWYEQEMVNLLQTHTFSGSDLWELPLPARNAAIYALIKERSLKDVLAEFYAVHTTLEKLLETLSLEDFVDPSHFAEMPADWQPWQVIASNTYEHYPEHAEQIKGLIKQ